jgi:hypothetical protein
MKLEDVIGRFFSQVVDYLPSLAAGLLLVLVGLLAAWFVKRVTVQILLMLRPHRLLHGFRWARGLGRTDVRLSLYNVLGDLVGFVIFLVFLNAAFAAMRLSVVSALVEKAVLVVPRVLVSLAVFGFGAMLSLAAGTTVRRALQREGVPRPGLIATFVRGALLLLFGGMALEQLDVAREVVVIGFTIIYLTLATLTVVALAVGGNTAVRHLLGEDLFPPSRRSPVSRRRREARVPDADAPERP